MSKIAASLVLVLLAMPVRAADPLPANAAASVRGTIVSHGDLMLEVVKRMGRTESGRQILQRLLVTRALELEAKRRKVEVPDADLDAVIAGLEKSAGGAKAFDAKLKKEGRTRDDLRTFARLSLIGQKMAAADLRVSGTPGQAQVQIWLDGLLKRQGVEKDAAKLPDGIVAKVGDETITATAWGEAIEREAGTGVIGERCLEPWIAVIAIEQDLTESGIAATDADVAADLARRKAEFEASQQARTLKIKFEQMIQAQQGRTLADLAKDREYRTVLGLRKLLDARLTEADLKAWYEKNPEVFGERRKVQQILVKAGEDKQFGSGGRSFADASRIAHEIVAEIEAGTAWETVATRSDAKKPEQTFILSQAANAPKDVLDAVFAAEAGAIVGPVKTLYGYHVLRLLEVLPPRTFEATKAGIRRAVLKEKEQAFYRALRDDPKVIRAERYR